MGARVWSEFRLNASEIAQGSKGSGVGAHVREKVREFEKEKAIEREREIERESKSESEIERSQREIAREREKGIRRKLLVAKLGGLGLTVRAQLPSLSRSLTHISYSLSLSTAHSHSLALPKLPLTTLGP